ncbi:unnamed protein product [Coffea canephora]|uniref:Glutathione S-transferase n=1 Tax=Coffea canephora TaxID=49390 RepID=A0A068V4I1_COFCA|nr:unnamed protein product [Coffea canephora]
MSGEDLKLLGTRSSSFVWRTVWALKIKGLEYTYIEENLYNKSSLLLELNPVYKKVPVLVHRGKPICESLVIIEYIDETWKENPILPEDPLERAYARFWAKFSDEKLAESAGQVLRTTGEEQAKALERMTEAMEILEREISGKKFFGGDKIGYLDIVIGWSAYWLQFLEEVGCFKAMDSTKYPCLHLWMKNFIEFPLIKKNLPTPDELLSTFRPYRNMILARTKG